MNLTSTRSRRNLTAIVACLATAFVASCGSSAASGDEVASLGSTDATTATHDTTPTSVDPEDAFVEYSQCMRDHGIDLPDPQVISADDAQASGGGQVIRIDGTLPEGKEGPAI